DLPGDVVADELAAFIPGDAFVVTLLGLGGGGENGFGQTFAELQSRRQTMAADLAVALVILPSRAGEVAPHDAFDGQWLGFPYDHRAVCKPGGEWLEIFGEVLKVRGDDLVGEEAEAIKPEG